MSTQPTDDEIVALADSTGTAEGGTNGYILPISFARAVLAKWGTPQPVVREPLSDAEIEAVFIEHGWSWGGKGDMYIPAVRDIERAHGITQKGGSNA